MAGGGAGGQPACRVLEHHSIVDTEQPRVGLVTGAAPGPQQYGLAYPVAVGTVGGMNDIVATSTGADTVGNV